MAKFTPIKLWFTRWTVWEYLPWWVANIPVIGFWLWFSLRARHLFFFSNVNPAIPLGGAVGESKSKILRLLPTETTAKWILVEPAQTFDQVQTALEDASIGYPLIAKPDVGERGFLVKKIDRPETLQAYLRKWPVPFILQEFLTEPMEASILFHRFPGGGDKFGITSICLKEFLTVCGDGLSTIRMLMGPDPRSAFQIERFEREFPEILNRVPKAGEIILLEQIGNHALGTKFLNGNYLIDASIIASFKAICQDISGVCYGRFDLKFSDVASLQKGVFKTMELNGILGEPAHIYDPAYGVWRAYRDQYRHWQLLYRLHCAQKELGIQVTPLAEGWRIIQEYFRYKRALERH